MNNLLKGKTLVIILAIFIAAAVFVFVNTKKATRLETANQKVQSAVNLHPLAIEFLRSKNYPGSEISIEETLGPTASYNQYLASYKSEGLKIYALLTIPKGQKPKNGWPVILFNHGYIPPDIYRTTEKYVAYVDSFTRNGYIVFKPDYRGNGESEGEPEGAYYSPAYTVDDLNALAAIKNYKDSNPNKVGVWGHSLGGNITLRDLVIKPNDIKAAVIWGGVVGSYEDLMYNWRRTIPFTPSPKESATRNRTRTEMINKYGDPKTNPTFWHSIDPTYYLASVTAPIQLHASTSDETVPVEFSQSLYKKLQDLGKSTELYTYPGGDHNISSPNFEVAMQRSIEFFDKYLKSED